MDLMITRKSERTFVQPQSSTRLVESTLTERYTNDATAQTAVTAVSAAISKLADVSPARSWADDLCYSQARSWVNVSCCTPQ